ncbi:MAG: ATP-binding protein [Clostridia bacterium]
MRRAFDGAAGAGGGAAETAESRAGRLAGLACLSVGRVSRALAGALALGRVSHAYLFAVVNPGLPIPGDGGTDRAMAAALTFARRLNCEAPAGDSACGKCVSCRLVAVGNHPDLRIVSPDGLSVKIDQIRELKREMSLTPRRAGGVRVAVVEGAEKMTVEAQNSFLRLLEEPPEGAVFILVCLNPAGLLPTVRSRCQLVCVRVADVDGQGGAAGEFQSFVETVRKARTMSPIQVLEAAETFDGWARSDAGGASGAGAQGEPRQRLEAALVAAAAWFRDVLVYKSTGNLALACGDGGGAGAACWDGGGGTPAARASELARDAAAHSVDELIRMIDVIEGARRQVRRNANMRLALEAMLFTLRKRRL